MTDDFELQPSNIPQPAMQPGETPEAAAARLAFLAQFDIPGQIDTDPVTTEWKLPLGKVDASAPARPWWRRLL